MGGRERIQAMVERWAQEAKEPTQTLATAEGRADEFH